MSALADNMYTLFQNSKMEGSYFLLFAISLVVLFSVNERKNKWLALYPVAIVVLVVANPVTVWLLSLVFPVLGNYGQLIALIPLLIYIPFAATELIVSIKNSRARVALFLILLFLISVCGNLFGLFGGDTKIEENHYNDERKQIIAYADEASRNGALILADDEILPFITNYGDNVPILYGQDIMMFNSDLGILDRYDDGIIAIHNMMWDKTENFNSITAMAYAYGCDIIIVRRFDRARIFEGCYDIDLQTENYLVYKVHELR